ncbi:MAG: hypothetical protein ACXV3F_02580 [Frankiaceae bacterium]
MSRVSVNFDEAKLVSHAGLAPVAELARRLRVAERIDETVTVAGSVGQPGHLDPKDRPDLAEADPVHYIPEPVDYELAVDQPARDKVPAAFTELIHTV